MSGAKHSRRWYDERKWGQQRQDREGAKERKRSRKVTREMERRDLRVTRESGEDAHGACGRKKRYRSLHGAETYMRTHPSLDLSAYRCPYCGGWHLTSHPREQKTQDVV